MLYWISTGLMLPVFAGLLFLFARSLFTLGSFYSHYSQKTKTDTAINTPISNRITEPEEIVASIPENDQSLVAGYCRQLISCTSHAEVLRLMSCFEIEADRNLSASKTLSKLGPILGLMGTLIPMGPALVGLAAGDISSMAYNMQVAFATTVIGLLVGAIGYMTMQVKQRWFLQDYTNLEYLSRLVIKSKFSSDEETFA
jgi:biopolymer transport protein ExbB/TolQ